MWKKTALLLFQNATKVNVLDKMTLIEWWFPQWVISLVRKFETMNWVVCWYNNDKLPDNKDRSQVKIILCAVVKIIMFNVDIINSHIDKIKLYATTQSMMINTGLLMQMNTILKKNVKAEILAFTVSSFLSRFLGIMKQFMIKKKYFHPCYKASIDTE